VAGPERSYKERTAVEMQEGKRIVYIALEAAE